MLSSGAHSLENGWFRRTPRPRTQRCAATSLEALERRDLLSAVLLGDIAAPQATPLDLTVVGTDFFFVADDGLPGSNLWRTTGSSVPVQVAIPDGQTHQTPTQLTVVGTTLYFVVENRLWKATPGSALAEEVPLGANVKVSGALQAATGRLYFSTTTGVDPAVALRMVDVTQAPLVPVLLQEGFTGLGEFEAAGAGLYFVGQSTAGGSELWKSDGTLANTMPVKEIVLGSGSSSPQELLYVAALDTLFFTADDGQHGRELWKTTGTAQSTILLKDIQQNQMGSNPLQLQYVVPLNAVFFTADDGATGRELWKTDGSVGGTQIVANIRPGVEAANPLDLTVFNNQLFFVANDGEHGPELWQSNGTQAGTKLVKNIRSEAAGAEIRDLTVSGSRLFFVANDNKTGAELWSTDGTSAGTLLNGDLNPGLVGSNPQFLKSVTIGGQTALVFQATNNITGIEVWSTLTTGLGAQLLVDLNPQGNSNPQSFTVGNGQLLFIANNGLHGADVFRFVGNFPDVSSVATQDMAVLRSAARGTAVGTVQSSLTGAKTFAILSGNATGIFRLDDATGALTVERPNVLASLSGQTIVLSIRIASKDSPDLSETVTVTVRINNNPVLNPVTFDILRDAIAGTTVGTLAAVDDDQLTYSIIAGNASQAFEIVAATGEIKILSTEAYRAAWESNAALQLTVLVLDNGTPVGRVQTIVTLRRAVGSPTLILTESPLVVKSKAKDRLRIDAKGQFLDLVPPPNQTIDYANSTLEVLVKSGGTKRDKLKLVGEDPGPNRVTTRGKYVYFNNVKVGNIVIDKTQSSGAGPRLTVRFEAAATTEIVQAVMRRVAFSTKGAAGQRAVQFEFKRANLTATQSRLVNVVAE